MFLDVTKHALRLFEQLQKHLRKGVSLRSPQNCPVVEEEISIRKKKEVLSHICSIPEGVSIASCSGKFRWL